MKIHLVGLPISTHRRLKQESGNWHGAVPKQHQFIASPISTNEYATFSDGEIRDILARAADGFTHIAVPAITASGHGLTSTIADIGSTHLGMGCRSQTAQRVRRTVSAIKSHRVSITT